MATPALKLLSQNLGPSQMGFLALKPAIATMARESGLWGEVYAWDPDREGFGQGLDVLRRIRARSFARSLALFPSSHWKFSLFHALIGARERWGFDYPHQSAPRRLQSRSLPLQEVHDVLQNLRLAREFLGLPADAETGEADRPFLPLSPVNPAGMPPEPFFACHPGSSAERGMADKRLPPETFAFLIRAAHRETGLPYALVGGPEEKALREAVASGCPEALVDLRPQSLAETAGLLKAARFFLGNDSGLMHIAAAAGTRCAAIFGPTDERRNGPYGYWEKVEGTPRHLILRRLGLDCSPCRPLRTIGTHPPCVHGDVRCLRNYEGQALWAELKEWLRGIQ